jgi:hypothetical protein
MHEHLVLLALLREGQRQVDRAERHGWQLADVLESKRTATAKRRWLLRRWRRPEPPSPIRPPAVATAGHDEARASNELPAA